MIKRFVITAAFVIPISGCQQTIYNAPPPIDNTPPPHSMSNFPEKEYAALKHTGTSTVTGQVFLKTRGGDVKYGAGEIVKLAPKTNYAVEYTTAVLSGKKVVNLSPKLREYTFNTQADGSGHFIFKKIPAGDYYLLSRVVWVYGYGGYTGGDIIKEITVSNGETVDIMLTL